MQLETLMNMLLTNNKNINKQIFLTGIAYTGVMYLYNLFQLLEFQG